jgi:hypothetical protein
MFPFDLDKLYSDMVTGSPQLERGLVWCRSCGATQKVDSAHCLRHGWPKCCGATMSIDAPDPPEPAR